MIMYERWIKYQSWGMNARVNKKSFITFDWTLNEIDGLMIEDMNLEDMDCRWTNHGDVNNIYNNQSWVLNTQHQYAY